MTGPLSAIVAVVIGKNLAKGFNESTARIAVLAESGTDAG
jgi:hypothetical protein